MRIYGDGLTTCAYTAEIVLEMVDSVLRAGGRVILVDPELRLRLQEKPDVFWARFDQRYPNMRTITNSTELPLLSQLVNASNAEIASLSADDRILYIDNLNPNAGKSRDDWLPHATEALKMIHNAAGRRLGVSLEDEINDAYTRRKKAANGPILVVVRHVDTRTRASGLYHAHYRAANIAIIDLKAKENNHSDDLDHADVDTPATFIYPDQHGGKVQSIRDHYQNKSQVASERYYIRSSPNQNARSFS